MHPHRSHLSRLFVSADQCVFLAVETSAYCIKDEKLIPLPEAARNHLKSSRNSFGGKGSQWIVVQHEIRKDCRCRWETGRTRRMCPPTQCRYLAAKGMHIFGLDAGCRVADMGYGPQPPRLSYPASSIRNPESSEMGRLFSPCWTRRLASPRLPYIKVPV